MVLLSRVHGFTSFIILFLKKKNEVGHRQRARTPAATGTMIGNARTPFACAATQPMHIVACVWAYRAFQAYVRVASGLLIIFILIYCRAAVYTDGYLGNYVDMYICRGQNMRARKLAAALKGSWRRNSSLRCVNACMHQRGKWH